MLCNFDEFWIYDFDVNIYEPLDRVTIDQLAEHSEAFGFLMPVPEKPVFALNREDVTRKVAFHIAGAYTSMLNRRLPKTESLRFCLQCVVAMFSEDAELLPNDLLSRLIQECLDKKAASYDLLGGLFREMNTRGRTPAGRYQDVEYFNGGIFQEVFALELSEYELQCFGDAAKYHWGECQSGYFWFHLRSRAGKGRPPGARGTLHLRTRH
mgnify:CR=1 FL=1